MNTAQKITEYFEVTSTPIYADGVPLVTLVNGRCHINAVASVRAGRADGVWLVWTGTEDGGCVHFINSKNQEFFDETLPSYTDPYPHYLIREVRADELTADAITDLLCKTKRALVRAHGGPLAHLLIDREVAKI